MDLATSLYPKSVKVQSVKLSSPHQPETEAVVPEVRREEAAITCTHEPRVVEPAAVASDTVGA